jgi:hypothetical protein
MVLNSSVNIGLSNSYVFVALTVVAEVPSAKIPGITVAPVQMY